MRECPICHINVSNKAFKRHIETIHMMDFDTYLRTIHFGCEVGKCLNCGKQTTVTLYKHSKFCDNHCQLEYQYKNETEEQKVIRQKQISDGWTEDKKLKQSITISKVQQNYTNEQRQSMLVKYQQTNIDKYGVDNALKCPEIIEQIKQTNIDKYGVDNVFRDNTFAKNGQDKVDKVRTTCLEKYGHDWIPYMGQDNNLEKRKTTCIDKYGVEHYVKSDEYKERQHDIIDKIFETKKQNGTTNTSAIEDEIYSILVKHYNHVIRNYKSELYPFHCDFYIPSEDMYIEYNGFFTHGGKSYNEKTDKEILDVWIEKAIESDFYKNAITVWTIKDPLKRKTAKDNKLKYLEVFSFTSEQDLLLQIKRISGLKVPTTTEELLHECELIRGAKLTLNSPPSYNKNIKEFQPHIYEKENLLYINDPVIRRQLIENRIKYLFKAEDKLTDRDLLTGFKISAIYRGFSFFSPVWFRYFITKYKCKKVYDPFGGWGHRLLGASDLDSYIYNDLDERTCTGVKSMISYHNIKNTTVYNNDANNFIPTEDFDSIFMCPPYDNIEVYNDTKIVDFNTLMSNVLTNNYLNRDVKYCGIIIKETFEELLTSILGSYISKEIVNQREDHFTSGKHKTYEYLYVWSK